jgi:competence protein ComEA
MSTFRSLVFLLAVLLSAPAAVLADPVDINSADAETLASSIDGVGTQKAIAIVQYREANGPFSNVDDLVNVQGIGMKTIERNRDKLTVVSPAN